MNTNTHRWHAYNAPHRQSNQKCNCRGIRWIRYLGSYLLSKVEFERCANCLSSFWIWNSSRRCPNPDWSWNSTKDVGNLLLQHSIDVPPSMQYRNKCNMHVQQIWSRCCLFKRLEYINSYVTLLYSALLLDILWQGKLMLLPTMVITSYLDQPRPYSCRCFLYCILF